MAIAPGLYAPERLAAMEEEFVRAHPEFASTGAIDELRATDYGRLDDLGHVYLDYTGGGLYAETQLAEHFELLRSNVFGNPHSVNPTSAHMTELVEQARRYVLEYFNASPDEYVAIFTANATGALRLVGEAYPFRRGGRFLLTFDNHNSVNGIREFAREDGAETVYVPSLAHTLRVDSDVLSGLLDAARPGENNLFAFPAQSNFSGVQHQLEWIDLAHRAGWDVLLDCAAFVPTNRLDLSRWHPDFVPISFYKLFGWPTGVGCLLARGEALRKLHRPWFSGGTIAGASVQLAWFEPQAGAPLFEDGTVNYLNLPAIEIGLRWIERIGIDTIHARVQALAAWLLEHLVALRHTGGQPATVLYGPLESDGRGGTIAFNFLHPDGRLVDERYVEALAARHGISIRTGCLCNPGAREVAFPIDNQAVVEGRPSGSAPVDEYLASIGMPFGGAVRVSLGLASTFADAYRFLAFATEFIDLAGVPRDATQGDGADA